MFNDNNFKETEKVIAEEEYRLASETLVNKDWAEEEQQFEQLEVYKY